MHKSRKIAFVDKFKYFLMCINREMLQYQKQFVTFTSKNNGNKKGKNN